MAVIRVVLADDHAVVRDGIRRVLEMAPDIEVVGEAGDGLQAIDLARTLRPDVVLMDIGMPGMSGIEATRRIRNEVEGVQVLGLTVHEEEAYAIEMLKAGACGCIAKRAAVSDLIAGIHAASRGQFFFIPLLSREAVREALTGRGGARGNLTERERDVLVLVAEGLSNADISRRLAISVKTVQTHRTHIMEKLDLHDRVDIVRYAVRTGLIQA